MILRRAFAALCLGLALTACPPPTQGSDGGDEPIDSGCPPTHACRPVCAGDGDCHANEQCAQGVCAAKPPTTTSYAACAIDADCPRGDHCKLGACGHDCLDDAQCTGVTVCDARGLCVAEAQAGQPRVDTPRSAGVPTLAPMALDFGTSQTSLTVTLSNTGGEPFDFRVLSSQPWLSATPFEGRVSGQPVTLAVTIDRAHLSGGSAAFLGINTSAGYLRLPISLATSFDGEWAASFTVEQPIALGSHFVPVILQQQSATLGGWVDGERSAVYPVNAAVSGAVGGSASAPTVNLSFELGAATGTPANPVIATSMTRLVELTLAPTGAARMEGTFKETVRGLVGAGAVVTGKVTLVRVGPFRQGTIAPAPTFTVPAVPDPFVDAAGNPRAAYQACHSCPGGACATSSSGFANNGQMFITYAPSTTSPPAALRFFSEFDALGYGPADGCMSSTAGCTTPRFDPSYLRCGQYWKARAAREASDTTARANFVDLVEVPADAALFDGNAAIALAHDAWVAPSASLGATIPVLEKGVAKLEAGLFTPTNGALAFGDPGMLTVLASFPADGLAHQMMFPVNTVPTGGRASGEAIRRALYAGSTLLLASNDLALTKRKTGDVPGARATVARGIASGYYLAAGLGQLVAKSPTTWQAETIELVARWQDLCRALNEIDAGRNALGFAPGFVPFYWKLGEPGGNYSQIRTLATGASATWRTLFESANVTARQFETSQTALTTEVQQQDATTAQQLQQLCGAGGADLTKCGNDFGSANASEVAQLLLEAQVAARRISQVERQAQNVLAEIKIEQDRAAAVAGVAVNNAMLIRSTGEQIAVLDHDLAELNKNQEAAHNAAGVVASFGSGNIVGGIAGLLSGGGDYLYFAGAREDLEAQRAALAVDQQATIEFSHATVELINSAATIKSKHLQLLTLQIDQDIAMLGLAQAMGRVKAAYQRAEAIVAENKRLHAVAAGSATHVLAYRVYSNYTARQALAAGVEASRWAFLAGRALDYQLNQSANIPWADLWKARSPNDLQLFLSALDTAYGSSTTSQPRTEVISFRDKILQLAAPIKDPSTGQVVNAAQRFRAFVASPANRDADGNFHVRFSTIDPANPIFSTQLASDRVVSIRMNLVGDQLGTGVTTAQIRLVHGGTSFLRSLTKGPDGTAPLIAYDVSGKGNLPRVSIVQAAVNAPPGSPSLQENSELRERAVLATGWELVIDQTANTPANASLSLSGLDDIELTFTHDAYTIQ